MLARQSIFHAPLCVCPLFRGPMLPHIRHSRGSKLPFQLPGRYV